jgi:hypothetical protein
MDKRDHIQAEGKRLFEKYAISDQTVQQEQDAVSVQPAAASVYDMGSGRLGAFVSAVLGLIGVVIGGLALARSSRTG